MNWLSPLVKKRISFWLLINWFFSSLILPLYMPLAQAAETGEMRQLMADSALDTDSRMSVTEGSRLLARKETVQPYRSSRKVHLLPSLGTDTAKSESA
ncbi:hypothetical protein Rin_00008700 [Candidatus Regiella insecticola 5.15]|uniref:Uncharacterized protein n=1 Tax=Candidatus Regiella insecticola 5.15 TaxID=1005043 RepID=G2GYK9_9ENTR|nr:hypothetical protein [Candidatus Regiella insecticola]EGY29172.1 hypothetical protein Rin_00008700 [Candidatus Regiella insecticola 5.15]